MGMFKVQAWRLVNGKRVPGPEETFNDVIDGKEAAFRYAYRHGIPRSSWWNVGPSPEVVIRVTDLALNDSMSEVRRW